MLDGTTLHALNDFLTWPSQNLLKLSQAPSQAPPQTSSQAAAGIGAASVTQRQCEEHDLYYLVFPSIALSCFRFPSMTCIGV